MVDRFPRRLLATLILVCFVSVFTPAADESSTTRPTSRRSKEKEIATLETYYAKLYSQPLAMKPRLPKLIGLMSLARLDCEATDSALIEAVGNPDPMVAYLAWEILHARPGSLSAAYYQHWVVRGIELAAGGELPGTTIQPMLDAAVSISETQVKKISPKLFDLILARYSPAREGDVPVLKSAGQLLAAWNDPVLLQRVAGQLGDRTQGAAADYLLMCLAGAPASDVPLEQRRGQLQKLITTITAAGPSTRPYSGVGKLVAKPARITDPGDEQWHKELELAKLTISNFDLAWVIDSTGSMNQANQTVAAETARVMRIVSMFCDQTRVGAVYYRHEIDPQVQVPCCIAAANKPGAYQTKALDLNKDATALAAAMAAEPIPKPDKRIHNMHPGSAAHGGLLTAITKLQWTKDHNSRRVIVLIGDSPLTPGSDKAAADLAAETVKSGYQIHGITLTPGAIASWHPMIEAAGGLHFDFKPNRTGKGPERAGIENVNDFGVIARLLIKASIGAQYRDRVDPLFAALDPYIEQSIKTAK